MQLHVYVHEVKNRNSKEWVYGIRFVIRPSTVREERVSAASNPRLPVSRGVLAVIRKVGYPAEGTPQPTSGVDVCEEGSEGVFRVEEGRE